MQRQESENEQRREGTHPEQIAYRAEIAGIKEKAGEHAQELQQPGPAERLISYKDLFLEPGRDAMKDAREVEAGKQQQISDGKRPPFKSYAELHGTEPKSHRH